MNQASQPSSQAEVCKTDEKASTNDSDDERWDDKLVIDLDASNASGNNTIVDVARAKHAVSAVIDSSTMEDTKTNEQQTTNATKNGSAENVPLTKPKGKRGGQKKATDNVKNETSKTSVKAAKADKEKSTGNKPGRKKREKHSPPVIKSEASSVSGEASVDDPYKFDPSDEKIAGTATGKVNGKTKKGDQKSTKDAQTEYDWRSVAIVTEPENLGPCEPGTQVCLEGIVWQETNNGTYIKVASSKGNEWYLLQCSGVLVVNVTWKGKTYMGTLLDATKHDWSPPSCDSPTGDFEGRTPKGRGKRSRVPLSDTFKDINERKLRKEMRKQSGQNQSRPKSPVSPKSESGKRKGRSSECDTTEPVPKRGRAAAQHSSPTLIECPEPNCSKKYKQMNGLRYHQRNAHPDRSSPQVTSDATSEEPEKSEPVSSPESSPKTKRSSAANKKDKEPTEAIKKEAITPDTAMESPLNTPAVKNNTTSVITSTTNSMVNTNSTTPPSGNVPVATITPQVVKPACSAADTNEQGRPTSNSSISSASNRPLAITAPPKLISKPNTNNSSMAPISTITSPTVYNSTLKPIQPKPTILGEVTPNPGLHELMDQKKLKRKRSASKDELINPPAYNHMDAQKSMGGGSMHRFDAEHRGLLSTGGMINAVDSSAVLQSPNYSDVSDEGELKSTARRDLPAMRNPVSEGSIYSQNSYPIATVSPQKNAPATEKDSKKAFNRRTPSHSPVPNRLAEEKHQKHMHYLSQSWGAMGAMNPAMNAEFLHAQMMQMQNGANKERNAGNRVSSPKSSSFKSGPPPTTRDLDNRASNDRLQLLKENMDMKAAMAARHSSNETARDYSLSPGMQPQSSIMSASYQDQKHRELEHDHHKRELAKNHSPAGKMSQSAANKFSDSNSSNRYDKVSSSRSSPMPPPGSFVSQFISNPFLQFGAMHPSLVANPMLARAMPPFLPPGLHYPPLGNMSVDNKDNRNSVSPSYGGKPNHKIHELESAKSPRPTSGDRHLSAKNQTMTSQSAALQSAAAASMLGAYSAAGLHPGLFHQPPN